MPAKHAKAGEATARRPRRDASSSSTPPSRTLPLRSPPPRTPLPSVRGSPAASVPLARLRRKTSERGERLVQVSPRDDAARPPAREHARAPHRDLPDLQRDVDRGREKAPRDRRPASGRDDEAAARSPVP